MYTFQALTSINTVDAHYGFYFVSALAAIWMLIAAFATDEIDDFRGSMVIALIIVINTAIVSWNTGTIKEYTNTKVEAKLVGFVAEGYSEDRQSGKTRYRADVHNTYVVYEVNGDRALFPAVTGVTYPKTAILYKN